MILASLSSSSRSILQAFKACSPQASPSGSRSRRLPSSRFSRGTRCRILQASGVNKVSTGLHRCSLQVPTRLVSALTEEQKMKKQALLGLFRLTNAGSKRGQLCRHALNFLTACIFNECTGLLLRQGSLARRDAFGGPMWPACADRVPCQRKSSLICPSWMASSNPFRTVLPTDFSGAREIQ